MLTEESQKGLRGERRPYSWRMLRLRHAKMGRQREWGAGLCWEEGSGYGGSVQEGKRKRGLPVFIAGEVDCNGAEEYGCESAIDQQD